MTPVGFSVEFTEKGHRYTIDGEKVVSVTTALGVLDKSGPLTWWGMTTGVKGIVTLRNQGVEIPWGDAEGCVKLLTEHRLTTNHVRDTAATRGQSVHDALEAFAESGELPDLDQFPPEDRGFVQGLARALLSLQPELLTTEIVVGSKTHGFAGRYDAKVVVDGRPLLLDLKTGKALRDTVGLQLAAYSLADAEMEGEPVDGLLALCVTAEGEFIVEECEATGEQFLDVLTAYRTFQQVKAGRKAAAKRTREAVPA